MTVLWRTELAAQLIASEAQFVTLKDDLKFAGEFDDHDALVTLSAGAGGTDAQDWDTNVIQNVWPVL